MSDADAHWLWRHDAPAWLRAAEHELAQALAHASSRKTALVHARRGGGMALNAVLVALARTHARDEIEHRWGRSYVEHLQALVAGRHDPLPDAVAELARRVLAPPLSPPVVVLGSARGADVADALAAAAELVEACRAAASAV